MTIISGNPFTQLDYLNVRQELRVDGVIVTSGNGDVVGPGSSVDDNIVLFDGITGELIKDSGVPISNITPGITILGQAVEGVTVTITAPQIAVVGSKYIIKDESGNAGGGGASNITIVGTGALIDGQLQAVITADYGSLTLYSDGTDLWAW